MRIGRSVVVAASTALWIAPTGAFCANVAAEAVLAAWQGSAETLPSHVGDEAGAVRAITPDLKFAKPIPLTDSAAGASRLSYALPVGEDTLFGFDAGARSNGVGARNYTLSPSLVYTLNGNLAVSAGLDTAYFAPARLHGGAECSAWQANELLPLYTCANPISYTPVNLAGTRAGSIDADGWGYGYNLGATLSLGDSTRLGMRYRSGVELDVAEETVFHTAGPLLSTDLTRLTDQAVIAGLGLPESFAVGASHRLGDHWSIAGDVTWVNWSQFDEARIVSKDPRLGAKTENWENTYRYTLGLNYQHNDQWKYRVGAAYDQSPMRNNQVGVLQPLVNEDLIWVAFGVGYSPTPQLSLDVGYAYPVLMDPRLSNGLQHNLAGQFEGESDILSAQFKWRFE
jgi:long-chain fatty acid transport protein